VHASEAEQHPATETGRLQASKQSSKPTGACILQWRAIEDPEVSKSTRTRASAQTHLRHAFSLHGQEQKGHRAFPTRPSLLLGRCSLRTREQRLLATAAIQTNKVILGPAPTSLPCSTSYSPSRSRRANAGMYENQNRIASHARPGNTARGSEKAEHRPYQHHTPHIVIMKNHHSSYFPRKSILTRHDGSHSFRAAELQESPPQGRGSTRPREAPRPVSHRPLAQQRRPRARRVESIAGEGPWVDVRYGWKGRCH
jgi:hypothetical protein